MGLPLNQLAYAQFTINGRQAAGGSDSRPCINTFYYKRANLALPLTEVAAIAAFQAGIITPLAAACNVRWNAVQIICRFVDDPTRPAVAVNDASVGAIPTDSEPQGNTVSMRLRTASRLPRCVGAKRFGGVSEVDTTSDILVAGLARWQAVQAAVAANLPADANGNVWTPYVVSFMNSDLSSLPAATIVAFPVIGVDLRKNVKSLKSRIASDVY